jgi:hypothetical protein
MKITRKLLERAVEAVEENEGPEFLGDLDSSQLAYMLWSALRSIQAREQESPDHKVTLKVEALLSGLIGDPEKIDISDYGIRIVSNVDEIFDMISPKITRMEIR